MFAQSWLSTPADTHWNPACNLHINDRIDIYDLMIFCEYWLYPPDFIAHWKLDETSDNIAHDSRIFGLDGKLQGDASWTAGHIDNAVSLDGDGDYIALGNTDFLKPPLPITFALWIKLASLTDYQVIISLDTNNTAGDHRFYGSELLLMNTGEVAVSYGDGQSDLSMRYKIGNTQLEKDTWYHIAGVISGPEDMDIYINGELDDSDTYGGSGGPMTYLGGPAYLGSRNGSECYVHGQLDDVRIYTRALSELEIQNLAFQ